MAIKHSQNSGFPKTPEFCEVCGGKNFWISVYGGDWRCFSCDAPPFEGMVAASRKAGEWCWWDVMPEKDLEWLARPLYTPNQSFYGDFNSPIMSYGKHKGEPVVKVARIDRAYLQRVWRNESETIEAMKEIGRLLGEKKPEIENQDFWKFDA